MAIRGSNTTPGQRCIKWMLLVINFMFMVTGVLLILVGTTISTIFGDFSDFIDSHFFSPPALLVAVGIIMFGVSIFGCVGAIKHSTMLVNIYGCLMCLIFILEIAAAIAAFCLQSQIREMLIRTMRNAMEKYETSTSDGIDFMQSGLECCGIYSYRDWHELTNLKEDEIPISCCDHYASNLKQEKCEVYQDGCLIRMDILISQSAMLIGTGAITVAFVEFLGILCAFMLAKTIRRNKTIRDARRWQLQQNLGITLPGKVTPPSGYTQMESSGMNITRNEP
ncbi:CD63 antigen isoform X2 [Condylostylus longicornis]|nr:CD63 antigen isoform X2 [Condylostylus longicornis]